MAAYVEMDQVTKTYQMGEVTIKAADGISFQVEKGEFVVVVGPSGAGKTTVLNILGGMDTATTGKVSVDGTRVDKLKGKKLIQYRREDIGFVFQFYNLMQNLTALENVELALQICKDPLDAKTVLEEVGLGERMYNFPAQLSGGEQQRVAIARALAVKPRVLLLDEPLGALDLKLRREMQVELKKIQQQMGITFIYVTHDQEEALTMSDTVVVLNQGYIQQIGTPVDIYNEPTNAFVADFIGESNIIDGVMIRDRLVRILGAEFVCVDEGFGENMPVDVVIRPEDVVLTPPSQGELKGVVTDIIFKGVHYEMHVMVNGYEWLVHSTVSTPIGAEVGLSVEPSNIQIMNKPESEDEEVFNADA